MLIDIPVFISFNADNANNAYRNSLSNVFGSTFTLRFDPENPDVPAQYATKYPAQPLTKFWPFEAATLFEFMPRNTEKRLIELAKRDPESYFTDQEAARVLAAELTRREEAARDFDDAMMPGGFE